MAQLFPLEAPDNPRIGGILFRFPSGTNHELRWEYALPVADTLGVAKHLAARVLDELMKAGKEDDVRFTNWTSMTAGIQKMVKDWSDKLKAKQLPPILSPDPRLPS